MEAREVTKEHLEGIARSNRAKPTERDFINRAGYERSYRADGTYEWKYKFRPNVDGKRTKEGGEVLDAMLPSIRIDSERSKALQASRPRVPIRTVDGRVLHLDPIVAEHAARTQGAGHVWRVRGKNFEHGPDGMLFREGPRSWEPLGVRCLGTPIRGGRTVGKRGLQRDPDGNPWRYIKGQWRPV